MIKWEWLTFEALIVGLGVWQLVSLELDKRKTARERQKEK
jgi:hypothetical protein